MPTYRNDSSDSYNAINFSGEWQKVDPNETIKSFKVLGSPFTKTSDSPYKPLAKSYFKETISVQTMIPSGETLENDALLMIEASMDCYVRANSPSNPYPYYLKANRPGYLDNEGEIEKFYFTPVDVSGEVIVQALPEIYIRHV